jgi:hypothetical protein
LYDRGGKTRALSAVAYTLVALLALFELGVLWLMLHPQVPADYRAYYIDRTTTCLNQPVSGKYVLGETISFSTDGVEAADLVKVCGWGGPGPEGTDALGRTSRLRFAVDARQSAITLTLEIRGLIHPLQARQEVMVSANDAQIGRVSVPSGATVETHLPISAELVDDGRGYVDVVLELPNALRLAPGDTDIGLRSVTLVSLRLSPA